MDKLLDYLYQKFFLRDILSIMFCGLLISVTFFLFYPVDFSYFEHGYLSSFVNLFNKKGQLSLISYLIVISFSYMIGLIINFVRDRVQYWLFGGLEDYRCPNWRLHRNVSSFFTNYIRLNKKLENQIMNERMIERMTLMFQASGNFALTILICMSIGWGFFIKNLLLAFLLIVAFFLLIWFSITKFIERDIYLNKVINKS